MLYPGHSLRVVLLLWSKRSLQLLQVYSDRGGRTYGINVTLDL